MSVKQAVIRLSKLVSGTIPIIFFIAGLLNLIFNNPMFGFEGNILANAAIMFIGFPATKALDNAIGDRVSDEWDKAVLKLLLWFNSFMFFIAGIYSLTFGTLPDMIGIPMVVLVLFSSAVFLYRLWKWRWFQ